MRKTLWIVFAVIAAIFISIRISAGFLTDLLWFKSVGFEQVFTTSIITNLVVRSVTVLIFFLFFLINIQMAWRAIKRLPSDQINVLAELSAPMLNWLSLGAAFILALLFSGMGALDWKLVQPFLHSVSIGVHDPIFHLDVGYFLFRFPLLQAVNGALQAVLLLTLLASVGIYYFSRAYWGEGLKIIIWGPAKIHLSVLAILLFLTKIWGYVLAKQALLLNYTNLGTTGVDYTAAHARFFAFDALIVIAVFCVVALLAGLFTKGFRLLLGGVAVLVVSSLVLGSFVPPLMEELVVRPNQFKLEQPYLEKHIQATRQAFGLDQIQVKDFQMQDASTVPGLADPSISNLRLWDYRVLQKTYEQLQTIGPYYTFNDIDIDRYQINGQLRQVTLSARELDIDRLPENARNWVNLHLTYTHGYGLAMSGVREVTSEGQPVFMVGNFPPEIAPGLPKLTRPQIYFGEQPDNYIIVPNLNGEFDYPTENNKPKSVYYEGKDGISLNSLWNRLLFAARFGDLNFLLSQSIDSRSKTLFHRNIKSRLALVAPFLDFDGDPYLVMDQGRLFWIVDAYTSSAYYPYSQYHEDYGVNYIRNSVKAVIDAYDGTVSLYAVDSNEPILKVWRRVFPGLFHPLSAMPSGLRSHLRYPERLFSIQRDMLRAYHMVTASAFYDKQDLWALPTETFTGPEEPLDPYYLTLRLPGQKQGEFALFEPFTPNNKKNMAAWMVARSDAPHYGETTLYLLPKEKVIYGPYQIEGRIAQNPDVSKLLTLWGQGQSSVLRGNLLVIPLDGDFLYVEPFYIQSAQAQQPELKQVVLVYKDRIVLGNTLEDALGQLTGTVINPQTGTVTPSPGKTATISTNRVQDILNLIRQNTQKQQEIFQKQQDLIEQLRKELAKSK